MNNIISGPPDYWIPAHLSYGRFLLDNLRSHGERTALVDAETGSACSYRTLLQRSVDLATGLKALGVNKGDIVAVCSENRTEVAVTYIALIFSGATIATTSPAYSESEMTHVLNLSKPKYVFCSTKASDVHNKTFKRLQFVQNVFVFEDSTTRNVSKFAELSSRRADISTFEPVDVNGTSDVLVILCSSGTTGLPKGAMHTHWSCLLSAVDQYERYKSPEIVSLVMFTPWNHAFGFVCIVDLLNAGKTIVYIGRYREELLYRTIQNYKINLIIAVPTILVAMTKSSILDKYNMSSIKLIFSGAGALNSDTVEKIKKRIPTISSIIQGFGMTETFCVITNGSNEDAGSAGTATAGVHIKIVDIESGIALGANKKGEICIKSAFVMKGYIGNPSANKDAYDEEGFFKTGDIGYYTDDHIFYVVDRLKELIKYKGNQVPPAEVEEVLLQHRGVSECAVIGAPDQLAGELPTAFVVRSSGSTVTEQELKDLVASKLSNPKKLRGGVRFVKELPRNPTGKLLRRLLKETYFKKVVSKL